MASSKELKLRSPLKKLIISFFNILGYKIKKNNNFLDRWENFIIEANDNEKKILKSFEKICLASSLNL